MSWKYFVSITICVVALCLFGGGTAFAQNQEDAAQAEEVSAQGTEEVQDPDEQQRKKFSDEIIVTSTRREVNVRELPGSVTVTEGFDLESIGAATMDDYVAMVPGVNYIDDIPQRDSITMRGITSATFSNLNQGPVGIYVNEIPVSDYFVYNSNFDVNPFDVERVEFLKGPQGTLYGAGSLGGTMRHILNRPNVNRFEGALHLTVSDTAEGDGPNYLAQGMFNVPLAQGKFALRGVVSFEENSGWVNNVGNTLYGGYGDNYEQTTARIMASWTPSDKVRIDLTYMRQDSVTPGSSFAEAITGAGPNDGFVDPPSGAFDSPQTNIIDNIYDTESDIEQDVFNLTVEWDLGFADLLSSTSWLNKSWNFFTYFAGAQGEDQVRWEEWYMANLFGLPVEPGDFLDAGVTGLRYGAGPADSEHFFQEFRLVSKDRGRLDWIAGVYFANPTDYIDNWGYFPGIQDALNDIAPGAGDMMYPDDRGFAWTWSDDATELAFYGELGIDLSDTWKMNLGGRYTDYYNDNPGRFKQWFIEGEAQVDDFEMQVFAPKASINWRPSSDLMWYALISRGYRAGGINFSYILNSPDPDPRFTYYDTDDLWNYETGIRKTWAGGKIVTDLTAFYLDWSDIQLEAVFFDPTLGGINGLFNVAKAQSYGAEFLFSAQVTTGLSFNTSIVYNVAESSADTPPLYNYLTGVVEVIPAGTPMPASPQWSTATTLQYYFDAPSVGFPFIALDHFYKDWYNLHFVFGGTNPSHQLLGLRVGATFSGRWTLTLGVRNLTDERAPLLYGPRGFSTSPTMPETLVAPDAWRVTKPRTISLTVQKNF